MWGPGCLGSCWDAAPSLLPVPRSAPRLSQWAFHEVLWPAHSLPRPTFSPTLGTRHWVYTSSKEGWCGEGQGQGALWVPDPCLLPSPSSVSWRGQGSAASRRTAVWPRRACSGQQPWPGLPLTSDVGWDSGGLGSPPYPLPALGCRPHLNPHPALCRLAAPQADLPPSAHELSSQAADLPILRPQAAPCHSDPQSPSLWQG